MFTAGYTLPHLLYTNLSLQLIFTTISVPKILMKTIYGFIPTLYWWHEVSYVLELVYIVIAVLVVDSSRGSIAVYAMMSLWFTACWIYVYTRILYPSIYDLSLQLNLRLYHCPRTLNKYYRWLYSDLILMRRSELCFRASFYSYRLCS